MAAPDLLVGINGNIHMTPEGWQFFPIDGSPSPPARGDGPLGLAAVIADWSADLRKRQPPSVSRPVR